MPLMITKNLKVTRNGQYYQVLETTIDENGVQSNTVKMISSGIVLKNGIVIQDAGKLSPDVLRYLIFEFYTAPKYPAHLFTEKADTKCHDDLGCGEDPCICTAQEEEYIQQMADRLGGAK